MRRSGLHRHIVLDLPLSAYHNAVLVLQGADLNTKDPEALEALVLLVHTHTQTHTHTHTHTHKLAHMRTHLQVCASVTCIHVSMVCVCV